MHSNSNTSDPSNNDQHHHDNGTTFEEIKKLSSSPTLARKEKAPSLGTSPSNNNSIIQYFIRKRSKSIDLKESKSNHRVMMPLHCILKHNYHEKILRESTNPSLLNRSLSLANLTSSPNSPLVQSPSSENHQPPLLIHSPRGGRRDSVSSSDSSSTEDSSSSSFVTSSSDSQSTLKSPLSMKETDFGNVNFIRETFTDYLSQTKVLGIKQANVKLLFLDHFYEISRPFSKKGFENGKEVIRLMEQFCKCFVNFSIDSYIIDMELIEEKIHSGVEFPYLSHLYSNSNFGPVRHEALEAVMIEVCNKLLKKQNQNTEIVTGHVETELITKEETLLLKDVTEKIQLVCEMFYTELQDVFSYFQAHKKYRSMISVWLKKGIDNQTIPLHVLDLYKKKLEGDEKALNTFKFSDEDFKAKNIIDKDWNFAKYFSQDISTDWYVSCRDEKYVQWSTKTEYSYNDKDLRASKLIGNLNYPLEKIVKSFNTEKHLAQSFTNVKFHEYNPINESSSLQKYPSGILTSKLKFGPLLKKRSVKVIFSTKTKFIGNEMSEFILFFKSCDYQESGKDIPVTVIGCRVFTKLDKNRTRFLQVRMGNLGGLLNTSLIIHNKLSFKFVSSQQFFFSLKEYFRKHLPPP
ncbi:hypothetical protein NAEGRDRAFT_80740 [Naegleria gruberi]|uniref:Uncharacterized protein n=1 Tax=Naegleria gruberi TaxID=5762 RepID=D2VPD2_NAEGR|nr:uncharacterized protein NAEGRDRAFT_80740 [Naegleria gruberi]EFC41338.1 hypothetical protein NAEGRDRAFT_80740 [Naegleria gruberi]|eukprot:XP_002674082.1 hypothetical protein NAEGRDRAFT_80740 [Naegleria gruberi strain NEG-M]